MKKFLFFLLLLSGCVNQRTSVKIVTHGKKPLWIVNLKKWRDLKGDKLNIYVVGKSSEKVSTEQIAVDQAYKNAISEIITQLRSTVIFRYKEKKDVDIVSSEIIDPQILAEKTVELTSEGEIRKAFIDEVYTERIKEKENGKWSYYYRAWVLVKYPKEEAEKFLNHIDSLYKSMNFNLTVKEFAGKLQKILNNSHTTILLDKIYCKNEEIPSPITDYIWGMLTSEIKNIGGITIMESSTSAITNDNIIKVSGNIYDLHNYYEVILHVKKGPKEVFSIRGKLPVKDVPANISVYPDNFENLRKFNLYLKRDIVRGNLKVKVWTDDRIFMEGDTFKLNIEITPTKRWHILVLDYTEEGIMYLLFPNQYFNRDTITGGKITLPGPKMPFYLRIVPPFGSDAIKVFVSDRGFPGLSLATKFGLPAKIINEDVETLVQKIRDYNKSSFNYAESHYFFTTMGRR